MRRHAIVLGLGETGLSCVPYLQGRGYHVTVCDSREKPSCADRLEVAHPDVRLVCGSFPEALLAEADLLVASPGVPVKEPAIQAAMAMGIPVVGDIELFARACQAPVVAITGANGKSTVTTLVGDMLQASGRRVRVAGNIGVPVLTVLAEPVPDVYVLELSSFQLETTMSLNALAATVLNITPDHMDRYADLTEYAHAKARIFSGSGRMVINREDSWVAAMARAGREVVSFGLDRPTGHDFGLTADAGRAWVCQGRQRIMPVDAIGIPGTHNIANVLAAFALATAVSRDTAAMIPAVTAFRGLAHRTTLVGVRDEISWIDDSKGTNVGATVAALTGMAGMAVLIAGGDGKGADFSSLRPAVSSKARAVVLIGRDAGKLEAALEGCCPLVRATDLDQAVLLARSLAQPGDAVLLSPACASFDMFRNYKHRGEVFADAVRRQILQPVEVPHG
ncbi:MAG: UDP-N-acetylmuramoyl-L-alanine--D-glutamate ligase [Gammaproteobacteria bacterium]|nr:UDP-N-acetylmuramoyl-L-alanine--D-glutamate ligase [Gammaproteobacteria bacterium]